MNNPKIKFIHSIRTKLIASMICVIVFIVVVCMLLNLFILPSYYENVKTDKLISAYNSINTLYTGNSVSAENMPIELEKICNDYNIHIQVRGNDGESVYTSLPQGAVRFSDKFNPGGGFEKKKTGENEPKKEENSHDNFEQKQHFAPSRETITETDKYKITSVFIKGIESKSIELEAKLDNGLFLRIQTSVAPILESVGIFNRFLGMTGLLAIILAGLMFLAISRLFTKPIEKLNKIAYDMSELDFKKKFQGGRRDEIGMLGESVNLLSDKLEKAIEELKEANLKLQNDIDRKEKIDRQRKEFLSNVSHELKTPIAIIEAYAEGLNEMKLDEAERMEYCDVILDETKKMSELIKRLMALMKIESDSDSLQLEYYDITEQILAVIKQKQPLFEQSGTTVECDLDEKLFVWADEFFIEEVLINYLVNATKYCGGEKKIKVSTEKKEDAIRVCVFNTGEGIPEEELENIWKSFYMMDKARTRDKGSQGLGLSIVAAIMTAHNQKFGAYNTDDGIVFWIELKVKEKPL